ncbi:MAG: hypothetical protein QOH47_2424 [Sphingomonadales bacterium]|jgi:hypothetical protein|nr:hypothetical protein [Sphingomonadales bacterium]
MKRILAALVALSLSGCATLRDVGVPALSVAGLLFGQRAAPTAVAPLDQSKLAAANNLAASAADSLTMAFTSGQIARSQDQDTARPNFCPMVIANLAVITDEGGRALALGCKIEHHLDRAEAAFEARDAVAYADNLAKADTYTGQLTAMVNASIGRTPTP